MGLVLTSVNLDTLSCDGGEQLVIAGEFPINVAHFVYVGPTGTVSDPACYSGVSGQGYACYSIDGTTLTAYGPRLSLGLSQYNLLVTQPSNGLTAALPSSFVVRAPFFYSQVFALRSVLPPHYATGPRSLDAEPEPSA